MPTEKLPWSNLDRLNRHVAPMKQFASGGVVEELMVKPRLRLFPQPPPFVPPFGNMYQNPFRKIIPFGRPHM